MDLFNKVHIFKTMKGYIYEPNISLISLIIVMFNYAKPRIMSEFLTSIELHKTAGSTFSFSGYIRVFDYSKF